MTFCSWSHANRNQAYTSCWYQYFETLSKYFCQWLQKSFYTSKNVYIRLSSRSCERGTVCAAGLFYQLNKCHLFLYKKLGLWQENYFSVLIHSTHPQQEFGAFMGQGCSDMCRQNTIVFLNVAGFNSPILCMLFPGMNCLFKTTAETKRNMWCFYKTSGWTSDFRSHDWKSESWACAPTSPVVLVDDWAICCLV